MITTPKYLFVIKMIARGLEYMTETYLMWIPFQDDDKKHSQLSYNEGDKIAVMYVIPNKNFTFTYLP